MKKEGKVNVPDLCNDLNVSPVTIWKSLKLPEDSRLLFRTHGGETVSNPYTAYKQYDGSPAQPGIEITII